MKTKLHFLILTLAALAAAFTGCRKEAQAETYYAPSEVTLQAPQLDPSDLSVTLTAVYNGDETGIASAEFQVTDIATGNKSSYPADRMEKGAATVKIAKLEKDHDYRYNFVIVTPGQNHIQAAEDGYCSLHVPYDFVFMTQTTETAKILNIAFKGSAALVRSMALYLISSEGQEVTDVPQIIVHDGLVKALFRLSDWPGELYQCRLDMTLYDGSALSSQTENFSTFPMPETLMQLPVAFSADGEWTLTATYDGDDKTVLKAAVRIFNKAGELVETLTAACADRQAVAVSKGHDYGKYSWDCKLDLVDGSTLEAGPLSFTYAKPREFATLDAPYAALVEAGISTADAEGPFNFTYQGYDWEVSYLRARTDKGYLINGSSRKGYLCNVTPFPKGIKTVYINLTQSDRILSNYEFYAKVNAADEWTLVQGEQPDKKIFSLDLSDGNWHFFKFQSKGLKEIRLSGFAVEYFTEDPIDY